MHGALAVGVRQVAGRCATALVVFTFSAPPVIFRPPSNTAFPFANVRLVPLPIDRPPGQSIHQLPVRVEVPLATLQELLAVHRRYDENGEKFVLASDRDLGLYIFQYTP